MTCIYLCEVGIWFMVKSIGLKGVPVRAEGCSLYVLLLIYYSQEVWGYQIQLDKM